MKILVLAALLLSAPAALAQDAAVAGADPRDPRPARMEARHAASVLLQHRDSLALSPQQVRQLEQIHGRFAARNRDLWAAVRAPEQMERQEEAAARRPGARPASRARREGIRRAQEAAREAQASLRENERSTASEALSVLSSAQRERFAALAGGR